MTFAKSASIGIPLFLLEYFKLKFKKNSPNKHVSAQKPKQQSHGDSRHVGNNKNQT